MNNRKKMITAVVICIVVVLIAAAVVIYGSRNPGKKPEPESVGNLQAVENTEDGAGRDKDSSREKVTETEKAADTETEKAADTETKKATEVKTEKATEAETKKDDKKETGETGKSGQEDKTQQSSRSETTKGASAETSKSSSDKNVSTQGDSQNTSDKISLPYTIPDTGLVIEKFAGYDGVFIEDGSDSSISGVTAMVLTNKGKRAAEYVNISVKRNGKELKFEASAIPAGATVVVQEAGKTSYKKGTYTECSADVAPIESFEMSKDSVKVKDNGDNSLTVTNLTDSTIPCVRVFYKFYMEDESAYVGGITYTAKLTGLEAGKSQKITPSHFVSGSSRIMMVRTYDTEE